MGAHGGPTLYCSIFGGCCHCCLSGGSIWAKNDHKKWWKSWAASTRLFWSCGSCDTVGPLLGFNIQIHQNPPFPVVISSNTQSLNSLAATVSFEYSHTTSRFSMKPPGVVSRNSSIFIITQYWPTSSPITMVGTFGGNFLRSWQCFPTMFQVIPRFPLIGWCQNNGNSTYKTSMGTWWQMVCQIDLSKIRGVKRFNFLVLDPGERSKEMGATVQDLIQETATIKGAQPIPASRLGALGAGLGATILEKCLVVSHFFFSVDGGHTPSLCYFKIFQFGWMTAMMLKRWMEWGSLFWTSPFLVFNHSL